MSYDLIIEAVAERDLERLSRSVLRRIDAKIAALKEDPRPHGAVKLQGREGLGWRVRVGDYRVLYTIDDQAKQVSVYRVRARGSAYRRS